MVAERAYDSFGILMADSEILQHREKKKDLMIPFVLFCTQS